MFMKWPGLLITQDLNFTLPVRPVGAVDLDRVQCALTAIAPGWTVEREDVGADEATLVLLPDGGDDVMGPSFVISREPAGLRLDQVHWDMLTELGVYSSINDVVKALSEQLALYPDLTVPVFATIH